MALILLVLSIAPVVFFGFLIYRKDREKEPTETLVKLFMCGIGSTFLTLFLTKILTTIIPFFGYEMNQLNILTLIPYVFLGVALIEEFCKWIFVYKLEYNDQEFNHLYDGIVYATFVSLGFACFENILYVFSYGIQTAIVRALLAVPGHLCDGIMMGYYLSLAKTALFNNNKSLSKRNLFFSLAVPTVAHGVYDYLLFASEISNNNLFILFFLVFVVFFFMLASRKVKQLEHTTLNLNPNYITKNARAKMQYQMYNNGYIYPQYQQPQNNYAPDSFNPYNNQEIKTKYCSNCGAPIIGKYCSNCGKEV